MFILFKLIFMALAALTIMFGVDSIESGEKKLGAIELIVGLVLIIMAIKI